MRVRIRDRNSPLPVDLSTSASSIPQGPLYSGIRFIQHGVEYTVLSNWSAIVPSGSEVRFEIPLVKVGHGDQAASELRSAMMGVALRFREDASASEPAMKWRYAPGSNFSRMRAGSEGRKTPLTWLTLECVNWERPLGTSTSGFVKVGEIYDRPFGFFLAVQQIASLTHVHLQVVSEESGA